MESPFKLWRELVEQISDRDANVALVALAIVSNAIMTLGKIAYGLSVGSGWLIFNAVYLFAIGLIRYTVLRKYIFSKKIPFKSDRYDYEFKVHRDGGFKMFILGVTYFLCSLRMYNIGDIVTVRGIYVYWFIVFAVVKLTFAIYGMFKTRKREDPIMRNMKDIGLVDAGVSLVEVVYAYLAFMGEPLAVELSSGLGFIVSALTVGGGVIMLLRRKLDLFDAETV